MKLFEQIVKMASGNGPVMKAPVDRSSGGSVARPVGANHAHQSAHRRRTVGLSPNFSRHIGAPAMFRPSHRVGVI
jgi:hypothetical protein